MILIKEVVNSVFTSKTYILSKVSEDKAWLVDIGDVETVVDYLEKRQLTLKGVFITHGHFDHIYGLPSLIDRYPDCKIYTTEYGKKSLASDKLNMSRYQENPISYEGDNEIVVHDGESMSLFDGEPPMQFYETQGITRDV